MFQGSGQSVYDTKLKGVLLEGANISAKGIVDMSIRRLLSAIN